MTFEEWWHKNKSGWKLAHKALAKQAFLAGLDYAQELMQEVLDKNTSDSNNPLCDECFDHINNKKSL